MIKILREGEKIDIRLISQLNASSSRGMLPKAWYWINDQIFLVKSHSNFFNNRKWVVGYEPFSEVICHELLKLLGFKSIPYQLAEAKLFKEVKTSHVDYVSICPFVEYSFYRKVSLEKYLMAHLKKNLNEHPIDLFVECKKRISHQYLYEILLFDAIVGNPDRHLNNFEFYVDENYAIQEYFPIFDNGASLLAWNSDDELLNQVKIYHFDEAKPFRASHRKQYQLIELLNINKKTYTLIEKQILFNNIRESSRAVFELMDKERVRAILSYLKLRIDYFL